jgi:hypothetical protein
MLEHGDAERAPAHEKRTEWYRNILFGWSKLFKELTFKLFKIFPRPENSKIQEIGFARLLAACISF